MNLDEIKRLNHLLDEKDKEILRLNQLIEQERAHLESENQAIKAFYEHILTLMPGHVYWLDRNNVFLGCNDHQAKNAKLSSSKDIVGKTNIDLPWKDQAEELNNLNTRIMESGVPHMSEEYAVMADGTNVYLSNKTPLRDQDNNVIGLLGVSIDITERKKMEVALRHAKEQAESASLIKSEFIAHMSQSIRAPLSGIMELSHRLEQLSANPEKKQYAVWIYDSCKQLLKLLNDSFVLATRDNTQETDLDLRHFALRQSIEEISQLLYPKIQLNHIELQIDIDPEIPEHYITDAVKLYRVLLTLFVNAIKNTKEGLITIKVELLSQDTVYAQLLFSVSDSGPILTPELQSSLFNGSSTKETNQDLSLYLAQKYLGLLGSEIKIETDDNSSTFNFILSMKVA